MKKTIFPTVILALVLPTFASAQVPAAPVRPGLNLSQQTQDPLLLQQQAPANNMPASDLVQRGYQGQQQMPQGQMVVNQPAQPEEFFYVDGASTGPDDLAGGLSDYNSGIMTQAGSQLSGNYGSVNPYGSMPAGVVQDAWNRPFDNMGAGQSAPGSIRYQWTADLIMPVRLRSGMVTSIILPEWEAAQDVMIGDGSAVEASILRPNQVAVKSVQTGLDTSLSVIGGSGNVYTFYLRTEGRNTRVVTDMQVFVQAAPSRASGEWFNGEVRGAYVRGAEAVSAEGAKSGESASISVPHAASQGDEPVPTDRREFNLKMYEVNEGDRIIAPEYAYTDGRFTYLHYSAGVTDRPAVFRIVDGVEGRVNTRVTGRHSEVIIVEAIGDLVLRSGTRSVCIVTVDNKDMPAYRRN
jgi:type IV secretory pathway VirB9-like protein